MAKKAAKKTRKPRAEARAVPSRAAVQDESGVRLAKTAAAALVEDRCTDVVILDVRDKSQVTDFIVIGSGTSDRQMRTAATGVKHAAAELGETVVRSNLDERTTWVVLDCVNVIVHIFEPNTRAHYDIEMIYGDAPRIGWEETAAARRGRRVGAEAGGAGAA